MTGINPNNRVSIVDHITKARGEKTQYTSVSDELQKLDQFQGVPWECNAIHIAQDLHIVIDFNTLIGLIQSSTERNTKKARARTHATRAREHLIEWSFSLPSNLNSSTRITWLEKKITTYFKRI